MKEEKKKITSVDDLINAVKRNTDLIDIRIKDKKVIIPIYYNAHAFQTYLHTYKITEDKRKAFCSMLESMINTSKNLFKDNKDIQNMTIEDIQAINDNDLKILGEAIINKSDTLNEGYDKQSASNFYENFYKAIMFEYDKYEKHSQEIAKKIIEPFKEIYKQFEPINKVENVVYQDNLNEINKPEYEILKPENMYTNVLLKQMLEISENNTNIYLKTLEENRISNKETAKFNKNSYRIMIATLISTIVGIIIAGVSLWIAFKANK